MSPSQNIDHGKPVSILAVVVLYRMAPLASPSVTRLLAAAEAARGTGLRLHIRLADNTPGGQVPGTLPAEVEYCAYPANPGLAAPYNEALELAVQQDFDWLLTLDQDTQLPPDFLVRIAAEAVRYSPDASIFAIVPRMTDGGRPISPFCFRGGFLPVVLPPESRGIAPRHASAINSGSLLRCRAVQAIGGYDLEFPLHNSDTRLFQRIDRAGGRLAVAEITVPHELSILQRESRIRPERYRSMLVDECAFWDRHMGPLGRAERTVRLAGRALKGILQREDPAYRRITLGELRRRLLTSRRRRLRSGAEET